MDEKIEENEIKYCICAMVDLLGFSSHLEISSYDLRTGIGQQAVKRLQNFERLLEIIEEEENLSREYYPIEYKVQRINDAIFFTMDLDSMLTPSMGEAGFNFFSGNHLKKFLENEEDISKSEVEKKYNDAILKSIEPLMKFIGIVSRFHLSINKLESENFFPGARTVISTGFRRPFNSMIKKGEDHLSANFAFSNVYLAEKSLKGNDFFVESSILKILSNNRFSNNILKFSHFRLAKETFNCFSEKDMFGFFNYQKVPSHDIILFRKPYEFWALNPNSLTYLHQLPQLISYLNEDIEPDLSNIYFKNIFNAIKRGITKEETQDFKYFRTFLMNDKNNLDHNVAIMKEYIENGVSKIKELIKERKFHEENKNLSEEGKLEMRKLMEKKVKIELEPIKIDDFLDYIFTMGEELFNTFSLVLEGDLSKLDYVFNNTDSETNKGISS